MDTGIRRIIISAGAFIGVVLVMCLVAKVMMAKEDGTEDKSYQEALEKLSGESTDAKNDGDENASVTRNQDENADDSVNPETDDVSQRADTDVEDTDGAGDNTEPDITVDITPDPTGQQESSKHVIVLDAAHQSMIDLETEPIGPGASDTKYKVTSGAAGVSTGTPEYKLVLEITKAFRDELIARGYEVYMIRESDDVSVSDSERAKIANDKGEIVIHVHANSDEREGISGIMAFYPSKENKFVSSLSDGCLKLSNKLLEGLEKSIGSTTNWGSIANDNLTALNWTKIPASHIEVGFLSNQDEDKLMATSEYRAKIVKGLADGVDAYYSEN